MMDELMFEQISEYEMMDLNVSEWEIEMYFFPVSSNDEEYIPFL